jgi:hypothetical protein
MQQQIEDKEGMAYQRMSWDALKKSINGLVNKVYMRMLVQAAHRWSGSLPQAWRRTFSSRAVGNVRESEKALLLILPIHF